MLGAHFVSVWKEQQLKGWVRYGLDDLVIFFNTISVTDTWQIKRGYLGDNLDVAKSVLKLISTVVIKINSCRIFDDMVYLITCIQCSDLLSHHTTKHDAVDMCILRIKPCYFMRYLALFFFTLPTLLCSVENSESHLTTSNKEVHEINHYNITDRSHLHKAYTRLKKTERWSNKSLLRQCIDRMTDCHS